MATPSDQRLLELLEKWLKSLELHARYSALDNDAYSKIQPWVKHQRPSRWIIDLALQRTKSLRAIVQERIKTGDTQYSESLELVIFLANLVGADHIERFIPLAEPQHEITLTPKSPPSDTPGLTQSVSGTRATPKTPTTTDKAPSLTAAEQADGAVTDTASTREMPQFLVPQQVKPPTDAQQAEPVATTSVTATREMPQFLATKRTAPPTNTPQVARSEGKVTPPTKNVVKPPSKHTAKAVTPVKTAPSQKSTVKAGVKTASAAAADSSSLSEAAREQVIADAARLAQWGRKWYELAELIARMAGRPSLSEVRRILKENKSVIDAKIGSS